MVQQQKPSDVRSTRSKAMVILRAAAMGALRYEVRYLRQLLVLVLSLAMIVPAFRDAPPGPEFDYQPDAGVWACRIIFGGLFLVVNAGVLALETVSRLRPYTLRIYSAAILLIVIGAPLSYVMRLIFIDR